VPHPLIPGTTRPLPFKSDRSRADLRSYTREGLVHAIRDPWLAGAPVRAIKAELNRRDLRTKLFGARGKAFRDAMKIPDPRTARQATRGERAKENGEMVDDFTPGRVPSDVRRFVHKRLLRGVTGLVTGGPLAGITSFIAPDTPQPRRVQVGTEVKFRTAPFAPKAAGCPPLMKPHPVTGKCEFFFGTQPGPDDRPLRTGPGLPIGDVVMGQFGAGEMPGSEIIDRAVCRRGMVLGSDSVCYNRSQIRNADRMWPRGRRPLLTGGDMRAISTAARAGKRLEGATKRLQKIGLMKKPASRRIGRGNAGHGHVIAAPAQHLRVISEESN